MNTTVSVSGNGGVGFGHRSLRTARGDAASLVVVLVAPSVSLPHNARDAGR